MTSDAHRATTGSGDSRGRLAAHVLLVLLVVVTFRPVLDADWLAWDDDEYVLENDAVRRPDGLRTIWTTFELDQYAPLVFTSYWFEHRLWGDDPRGFHATNLALHVVNALLVLHVLRALGAGRPAAWAGAALFALHPVQVASVAWITERKNVLAATFYFASLLLWLRYCRTAARRDFAAALVTFAAALLSKSVTAALPLSMAAAWGLLGRRPAQRPALRLAPFFLLAGAGAAIAMLCEHGKEATPRDAGLRTLVAAATLCFYAARTVWPAGLAPLYERWQISAANWIWWLPLAACVTAVVVLWRCRRVLGGKLTWAAAHFAFALLPVLGLVYYRGLDLSLVWHHHLYFALLGPGLAFAAVLDRLIAPADPSYTRKPIAWAAAVGLLLALGLAAHRETAVWRDSESLFTRAVEAAPDSPAAHNGLGLVRMEQGDPTAAVEHWRRAIAADPTYLESYVNIANAFAAEGRFDEAIDLYRRAIQSSPRYFPARYNLAFTLLEAGRADEAVDEYRRAAALRPHLPAARFNLGMALLRSGRTDEARAEFERVLRLDPTHARAAEMLERTTPRPGQP